MISTPFLVALPTSLLSTNSGLCLPGNDNDDDEGHDSISGISGEASTTPTTTKNKRTRKRKGKGAGSGDMMPSQLPAGTPSAAVRGKNMEKKVALYIPTAASSRENEQHLSADELPTPTRPLIQGPESSSNELSEHSKLSAPPVSIDVEAAPSELAPSAPTTSTASFQAAGRDVPTTPLTPAEPAEHQTRDLKAANEPSKAAHSEPAVGTSTRSAPISTPTPSTNPRTPPLPFLPPPLTTPLFQATAFPPSSSPPSYSSTSSTPFQSMPKPPFIRTPPIPSHPALKSPFGAAVPKEKQLPPIQEGSKAPTMISHAQGMELPRRMYDGERLLRERADLESLLRRGGGNRDLVASGDSRDVGEGSGRGHTAGYNYGVGFGAELEVPSWGVVGGGSRDKVDVAVQGEGERRGGGEENVERQGSWSVGDYTAQGDVSSVDASAMPDVPHGAGVGAAEVLVY
ncbi:hypothetical protein ONS96_014973 [Cadophora gregata f. sp. sojae]|nr:hypothetical protein ONS96_014973 [Cadophora gregata f. sp. sojae]